MIRAKWPTAQRYSMSNHNAAAAIGTALMSVILTSSCHGSEHAANDLSHAYAGVFVVAISLVAAIAIPASFPPKRPARRADLMHLDP